MGVQDWPSGLERGRQGCSGIGGSRMGPRQPTVGLQSHCLMGRQGGPHLAQSDDRDNAPSFHSDAGSAHVA